MLKDNDIKYDILRALDELKSPYGCDVKEVLLNLLEDLDYSIRFEDEKE